MTAEKPAARRDALIAAGPPAAVRMFTALLTRGAMTRGELGHRTGFTLGAVTKALQPLIRAGLVHELVADRVPFGPGRPAFPLEVDAEHAYLIGVKITAGELIGVLTDLRAQVLDTVRAPLPSLATIGHHARTVDPDTAIAAIGALVTGLLEKHPHRRDRISGLGVAVSGDVSAHDGIVRFSPLLGWRDVALADRLEALISLPTTVENDVRALTVAEQWFGAGLDHRSFALVTVGTGVGCGLIIAGELLTGAHGVAGELGHLPVDPDGPECHCGGTGCAEALIGEAALLDRVASVSSAPVHTMADAIAAADGARGPAVRAIFDDAGRVLGLAMATVANMIGPERVVLSGETLVAFDLFAESMRAAFRTQCFGAARQCEVIVRPLRFEHWARGAATVAIAQLVQTTSPHEPAVRLAR